MSEKMQNLQPSGEGTEEVKKKPHEIDFRTFFSEILNPFTPPDIVIETIKELLPGDTQASDFEEIIEAEAQSLQRKEKEEKILGDSNSPKKRQKQSFKSLFFMLVNSMGLANEVSNIRHAIGVLGIIQVRNAIMGMSLYQHFNPKLSLKFDKIAGGEIEKPIKYALYAEEFAKQNRCSTHLAFIAGLLFDLIVNIIIQKEKEFKKIVSGPLKKPDEIIAAIWTHSLAVGAVAHFINHRSKAKIPHARFAFVAGVLHDIGKLGNENTDYYIPQKSEWHREKLGQMYEVNEGMGNVPVSVRTLWWLNRFNIPLTEFEICAIQSLTNKNEQISFIPGIANDPWETFLLQSAVRGACIKYHGIKNL